MAVIPISKPAVSRERIAVAGLIDGVLYYFSIFFPVFLSLLFFLHFFYGSASTLDHPAYPLLFWSKLFWFTGGLVVVSNMAGLLYFGSPRQRAEEAKRAYRSWNQRHLLTLAYVSRGDNREALARAVGKSLAALDAAGAAYSIEIVTDKPVETTLRLALGERPELSFVVVPASYETAHHTRYKARALQYLIEQRAPAPANQTQWILHLDEESSVTFSSIAGIHRFINNPQNIGRIGQGEIKYNAYAYGRSLFITALDSIRTGDDLGRFRLQYGLFGAPLFGMHGSFILLPETLERMIGFDFGRKGSITEDAYFALLAQERGVRFGWVDGYIQEQSPFSIADILRQRRRWFCGLKYLSFDSIVRLRYRIVLMIYTVLWSVAWMGPVVTLLNIALGGSYFPLPLTYAAALMQGGYGAIYLVGASQNLADIDFSLWRKLFFYAAALLLLPISSAIEGAGVLYALLSPVKTFEVVRK